jgi:hypothetical protein
MLGPRGRKARFGITCWSDESYSQEPHSRIPWAVEPRVHRHDLDEVAALETKADGIDPCDCAVVLDDGLSISLGQDSSNLRSSAVTTEIDD